MLSMAAKGPGGDGSGPAFSNRDADLVFAPGGGFGSWLGAALLPLGLWLLSREAAPALQRR